MQQNAQSSLIPVATRPESLATETRIRLLRNRKAILGMQPLLSGFAATCEQPGSLSDLEYFLDKPGALQRTPVLVLVTGPGEKAIEDLTPRDLLGAALLHEYRVLGLRTGMYVSNDRSGRNTVVAPISTRGALASYLLHHLLQRGAHLVALSFRDGAEGRTEPQELAIERNASCVQATRYRSLPDFLPLHASYDGTLAGIGQRTRSNLRYYRRRAERELGCRFVPSVSLRPDELRRFNRCCMYAVSDDLAQWRVSTLARLQNPILAGLKDRHGEWLCLLGGRRQGTETEILWQMNREDLPQYSLSLVMRAYLLEQEVARGATRLCIEGGTPHPIIQSFQTAWVKDVLAMRRTFRAHLTLGLAHRVRGVNNELLTLLLEPALRGREGTPGARRAAAQNAAPRTIP